MIKNIVRKIAIAGCIFFTLFMAFSLPFAYGASGPSEGLNITLGLLIAAFGGALLQGIWFTEMIFKNMRYPYRLLGFFGTFAPLLFATGWFLGWFAHDVGSAIGFFVIFAVVGVAFAVGYNIYFKITVGSYEKALENYRKKQGLDEIV